MPDTLTTSSGHASAAPHQFLQDIKTPLQRAKEKEAFEMQVEQRTAMGLELALNSLENIPGINGKLRVKLSVSPEGYQAYAVVEANLILPDSKDIILPP